MDSRTNGSPPRLDALFRHLPVVLGLVLVSQAAVADEAGDLASELSRLRGEVEQLSADLDTKKEEHRARLRSYSSQKTELEMEIQREELRYKQLRSRQKKQKDRIASNEGRKYVLEPAVMESIGILREGVRTGLPFKTEERLADLDRLERQLDEGTISVPTAFARLWSKAEDEFRLGRESGLYKQVIVVSGEESIADVARIGMVMLFFRTPDERYGRAVRTPEGWRFRLYETEEEASMVEDLFESFRKNIRVGFFTLPPALPEMETP